MRVMLYHYLHKSNGLSLEVIPETEAEQTVLDALWKFGAMEVNNSSQNKLSTAGFVVNAFRVAAEHQG